MVETPEQDKNTPQTLEEAEEKATMRALMQTQIDKRLELHDDQELLSKRLTNVNRRIDEYGYALYGLDYKPENVGGYNKEMDTPTSSEDSSG